MRGFKDVSKRISRDYILKVLLMGWKGRILKACTITNVETLAMNLETVARLALIRHLSVC
jgi:hypothetical protein